MELDNVAEFFRDKSILVTGATGFLAKIFVEKILRIQPNVNKLYLLLRVTDSEFATQRLYNKIINTELFRVLRESWGSKFDSFILAKVIAVPGDISSVNLGVKESTLREKMWKEIEIVVNVAATTNFIERYDVALEVNTFGAFNVLNFAKKCDKIKLFLHVSTAYVCGEQSGIISEKRFYMGETLKQTCTLDIIEEKRIVEKKLNDLRIRGAPIEAVTSTMKEFGLGRAKLYGWPNTYVFTKAMGEMLLENFKGDLPLVIIRPSVIVSTYKEPFPGWIEGLRTMDILIVSYGKGKLTCFPGNPNSALDVIPADMVVNAMVVAIVVHANHQYSCETIYHVSTSLKNPMKHSDLLKFVFCYFTQNPWINRNGQRVKVGVPTLFSTADRFFLYMQIKYLFPMKVLYLVNTLCCQYFKKDYIDFDRKIKFAMRLVELYKPYSFFQGIFGDTNLKKLQILAEERGINVGEFSFDSKSIDWEDYIMNIHILGLSRHVIMY